MNNDLISREALLKTIGRRYDRIVQENGGSIFQLCDVYYDSIINAPTVETYYTNDDILEAEKEGYERGKNERPQGEYFDMSKLRLMKVEECAGHTIDYAMGWKACIEWIKKGGAE